jgi:hypothetical protein
MLPALIVASVILLVGWTQLALAWHQARMLKRDPNSYSGLVLNVWPGIPAAASGGTLFVAAGWMLFSSGPKGGNASGARTDITLALVAAGFACFCWLLIRVFGSSKATFGRPVSYRPKSSESEDSGSSAARIEDLAPRAGERLVGKYPANHVQRGRGRSGHLLVTGERLIFTPASGSAARGARAWQVDLQGLGADVAPRGGNLSDGSLRHRLRVTDPSGRVNYFVVWRPRKLAGIINTTRRSSDSAKDRLR